MIAMKSPHPSDQDAPVRRTHDDFDYAARLLEATDGVPAAPAGLYRPVPWARWTCALAGSAMSLAFLSWAFFAWIYPPEVVREAMVHEHRESTLRGDFQQDKRPMLRAMGLRDTASLPGLLQLQRPCEISGQTVYHLTTFMEKGGGIVTIMAFATPLANAPSGGGSWMGRHWRFVHGTPGKTILLLADNARVLNVTEQVLKKG
jgi:hypothetical protein